MESISKMIKSYEKWVASNPETISDVEATTKWLSYFIAGKVSDSRLVSELSYSLSNLLVLYNDRILEKAKAKHFSKNGRREKNNNKYNMNDTCYRLKVMLTTLEYFEVLIEMSANKMFGKAGRWLIITLVQLCKALGRFFILRNTSDRFITSPALQNINRRELIELHRNNYANVIIQHDTEDDADMENDALTNHSSMTFRLKRSGRIVRKVEGAPPIQYRDFNLKSELLNEANGRRRHDSSLTKGIRSAEYLYIAKPLIHLASMGVFGRKSWKQYAISLSIDIISIRLYHRNRHLMNQQQKKELSRRCLNLLLYIVRSPFYEKYSQSRLEGTLDFVANHIPLARLVAKPFKDYLPVWQDTYFYLWST